MYSVGGYISAIYVHAYPYGSSYGDLKVYIPSLMPSIGMGSPKITPVSLNKSCYSNALDCRPSVGSYINTQNYVTARGSGGYANSCYYYGKGLTIVPQTSDCLSCRLAPDGEDNSKPWPENK